MPQPPVRSGAMPSAAGAAQPVTPTPLGLTITDLTIRFEDRPPVIEGLNLHVEPGQIVALVGASGCGKSTLLRAIAGLQPTQAGSLQWFPSASQRGRVNLSFVFQDATLLPWRTATENVRLPFELGRSTPGQPTPRSQACSRRVAAALQAVEMPPDSWAQFPRQLSGGMRMRTSIARALVTDPDLLLLDEPFAALDDLLRTKLNELLLALWQQRPRTILFVTHNIAEAIMLSHKVAVLGHRRIVRLIENQLTWPRSVTQRTSLEFAQQYSAVSQALTEVSQ